MTISKEDPTPTTPLDKAIQAYEDCIERIKEVEGTLEVLYQRRTTLRHDVLQLSNIPDPETIPEPTTVKVGKEQPESDVPANEA